MHSLAGSYFLRSSLDVLHRPNRNIKTTVLLPGGFSMLVFKFLLCRIAEEYSHKERYMFGYLWHEILGLVVFYSLGLVFLVCGFIEVHMSRVINYTSLVLAGIGICFSILAVALHRSMYLYKLERERSAQGLCLKCGYDLRASWWRCPECGDYHGRCP